MIQLTVLNQSRCKNLGCLVGLWFDVPIFQLIFHFNLRSLLGNVSKFHLALPRIMTLHFGFLLPDLAATFFLLMYVLAVIWDAWIHWLSVIKLFILDIYIVRRLHRWLILLGKTSRSVVKVGGCPGPRPCRPVSCHCGGGSPLGSRIFLARNSILATRNGSLF